MSPVFVAALSILFISSAGASSVSYEDREFLKNLTKHYDPKLRPVFHRNTNTTVGISVGLTSVLALDEKQEVLSITGFILMTWKDMILTWNVTKDTPNLLYLNAADVWTPTLRIINSVTDQRYTIDKDDGVTVLPSGTVSYSFAGRIDTQCKVNVQKFPFDTQECHIDLAPFYGIVSGEFVAMQTKQVNLDTFNANGEFYLLSPVLSKKSFTVYGTQQDIIRVTLTLKRRFYFYMLTSILPIVFLSILNPFVFALPEDNGDRTTLCISVLLSYAMYLNLVSSYIPANSDYICLLTVNLVTLVFLSTLICLAVICITILQNNTKKGKAVPRCICVVFKTGGTSEDVSNGDTLAKVNNIAFGISLTLTILVSVMFFIAASA